MCASSANRPATPGIGAPVGQVEQLLSRKKVVPDTSANLYAGGMDVSAIVSAIDKQISTLQQVKELLSTASATDVRAEKAVAAMKGKAPAAPKTGKRTMSPEGRARIAAAQKKRWAAKQAAPGAKSAAGPKKTA